ncbi:MAG: hypothetical protein SXV54_22920 [Chloroflexota bacterium]|nr:hypothetical protein [Chloroflexota bacterium]
MSLNSAIVRIRRGELHRHADVEAGGGEEEAKESKRNEPPIPLTSVMAE